MSTLLDTHYVYALAANPAWLTEAERAFLDSYPDRFVVSAVSIWEIRWKWDALHASGERKGPLDPQQALRVLSGQAIGIVARFWAESGWTELGGSPRWRLLPGTGEGAPDGR